MAYVIWLALSFGGKMKKTNLRPILITLLGLGFASFENQKAHAEMGRLSRIAQIQSWSMGDDITVVLGEDHRTPLVEIHVLFQGGQWSPWVHKNHLVEAFSIQKVDSQGDLSKKAAELATSIDTEVHATNSDISLSILKEDVSKAADLLRQVLLNRDFDRGELVRTKWAASSTWEANEKDPDFVLEQALVRLFYVKDDPRRIVAEKPSKLSTDTKELAIARDTYIQFPGRTIAIAGDLTKAEAEQFVARLQLPPTLLELPEDLSIQPKFLPWNPVREDKVIRMKGITQTFLGYARTGLPITDPNYPIYLLANHIFGGHFNSRLYTALREKEGDSYSPSVSMPTRVIPGYYSIEVSTRVDNTAAMEQKLRETLARFSLEGTTTQEWQDALSYVRGSEALRYRTPGSIVSRVISDKMQGLPTGFSDALFEKVKHVSLEELNDFIHRFYDPSQFTMVKVVPKE